MENDWLLLAYTVPAEPSRKRVAVWRRLRKLGAVYLDEGVWLLPHTQALAEAVREVVTEVQHHEGRASAFLASGLDPEQREELQARFNQAREREYHELLLMGQRFLGHIQREIEEQRFEFARVEELEEDLEKRRRWLAQIKERDVFEVEQRHTTEQLLQECQVALERFIEQAYESEGGKLPPV
jgi:DNA-binding transcriptional regulator PaaX